MNLDKIQDDFIKESKKLIKDIKKQLIHNKMNKIKDFNFSQPNIRKKNYYWSIIITGFIMLICLFLYFKIENQQWCNIFGNAFAGCLTGFIMFILENIKNKELDYYDNKIKSYEELLEILKKAERIFNNIINEKSEIRISLLKALYTETINFLTFFGGLRFHYNLSDDWVIEYYEYYNIYDIIKELKESKFKISYINRKKEFLSLKEYEQLFDGDFSHLGLLNDIRIELDNYITDNLKIMVPDRNNFKNGIL